MDTKLIYLAGPYYDENAEIIQERMEKLYAIMHEFTCRGEHIISPLFMHEVVTRFEIENNFDFWGPFCYNILKRCDKMVIAKLYGWDASDGVQKEINFCLANGIPIEYLDVL